MLITLGVVAIGWLLAGATFLLGRAAGVDRLLGTRLEDELRLKALPAIREMAGAYWPVGSGFGTFKPVFRVYEPDFALDRFILNHAHNDWLEVLVVGGAPGLALMILAATLWLFAVRKAWLRQGDGATRMGLVTILLLAIASLSDYPLRVPSLSCLFVLSALWARGEGRISSPDSP